MEFIYFLLRYPQNCFFSYPLCHSLNLGLQIKVNIMRFIQKEISLYVDMFCNKLYGKVTQLSH